MAHRVVSLRRKIRSLSERSGQVPASTLTNSVANDPTRTLLPFIAMSAFPPKRRCRVLPPPAPLYWTIVVAPTRIAGLGVPIALEKRKAVVAPAVAARNGDVGRRLA